MAAPLRRPAATDASGSAAPSSSRPASSPRKVATICDARLDRYFAITGEALAKAKEAFDSSTPERLSQARDFYLMASSYYEDAHHFRGNGHYVNAYAALNYAHGWLDAGARIRLFLVADSRLFTVDDA